MSEDFEIYLTGRVVDGKLQGISRRKLAEELKYFNDKNVELIVRRKKKRRSVQQNRYFHAIAGLLGKEIGLEKEQMKDVLKMKFLKKEKAIEETGEVIEYLEHTSKLSTSEFADFTNSVIRWAAELGVILPMPNEQIDLPLENDSEFHCSLCNGIDGHRKTCSEFIR